MTPQDKDAFLPTLRGIPSPIVARVLNRHHTGCNWHGCSKATTQELMFGTLDRVLRCIPPLPEFRDECRALVAKQQASREAEARREPKRVILETPRGCRGCRKLRRIAIGLLEWIDASKAVMDDEQKRLMRWESIERARTALNQDTKPIESSEL